MSIIDTIETDYKEAFKAHHQEAVAALRLIKSALKNAEIDAQHPLQEDEVVAVLGQEAKRRREAIAVYTQAGRQDLAAKETGELQAINAYLPAQMGDADLIAVVREVVASLGESGQDYGRVMGAVMGKVKGQADGSRVAAVVKQTLT